MVLQTQPTLQDVNFRYLHSTWLLLTAKLQQIKTYFLTWFMVKIRLDLSSESVEILHELKVFAQLW